MADSVPKCPECGGTGVVALFTSVSPCRTCTATGTNKNRPLVDKPAIARTLVTIFPRTSTIYNQNNDVIARTCWDASGNVTSHFGPDAPEGGAASDGPVIAVSLGDSSTIAWCAEPSRTCGALRNGVRKV